MRTRSSLLPWALLLGLAGLGAACSEPAGPGPEPGRYAIQVWSIHDDSLTVDLRITDPHGASSTEVRIDGRPAERAYHEEAGAWIHTGRARPDSAEPVVRLELDTGDDVLPVVVPVHVRSGPAAYSAEGHLALPVRFDSAAWTEQSANEVILYDAAGEGVFAWVLTGWQSPVMVAASALPSDPVRARTGFAGDLTRSRGGVRADVHIWALVYFDLP